MLGKILCPILRLASVPNCCFRRPAYESNTLDSVVFSTLGVASGLALVVFLASIYFATAIFLATIAFYNSYQVATAICYQRLFEMTTATL